MPSFAKILKIGHMTLTTPLLGVICHPKATTWYSLPLLHWRL